MIYIVHGEDLSKSRGLIVNQQKKLEIERKAENSLNEISPEKLADKVSYTDLFGNPPFLVLDVSGAGRTNVDKHIQALEKTDPKATVIILSNKSLPASNAFIKASSKLHARIVHNELIPKGNVFRFVDRLYTKNRNQVYKELQNLDDEDTDPFYIFSMIQYGLRNVANALLQAPGFKNLKPFVKSKTEKQSENFTEKEVMQLYNDLFKLEKGAKTGEIAPEMMITLAVEKVLDSK